MSEEPIIDNTDLPLSTWLRVAGPVIGAGRWLWFNLLRPLLLFAAWAGFLFFIYGDFYLALATSDSDLRFLKLCGTAIIVLLVTMMLVARLIRNREDSENQEADTKDRARPVQVQDLASVAKVPVRELTLWQRARSLVALHDDHGQFRAAVVKPLGEPVRRRRRD